MEAAENSLLQLQKDLGTQADATAAQAGPQPGHEDQQAYVDRKWQILLSCLTSSDAEQAKAKQEEYHSMYRQQWGAARAEAEQAQTASAEQKTAQAHVKHVNNPSERESPTRMLPSVEVAWRPRGQSPRWNQRPQTLDHSNGEMTHIVV